MKIHKTQTWTVAHGKWVVEVTGPHSNEFYHFNLSFWGKIVVEWNGTLGSITELEDVARAIVTEAIHAKESK